MLNDASDRHKKTLESKYNIKIDIFVDCDACDALMQIIKFKINMDVDMVWMTEMSGK